MTTVINIKNAPRGWQHSDQYVYIGRPGKGMLGPFGNPLPSVGGYREWLLNKLRTDVAYRQAVCRISGKILVCFCKPKPCHGDFLATCADLLFAGIDFL